MKRYLVESALLTQGLKSITDDELIAAWPVKDGLIAWLEDGEIMIGGIAALCRFRGTAKSFQRINYQNFDDCTAAKQSGALTASGTMQVCEQKGIPLAVTCGMGGIMTGDGDSECHDINALADSPVALVATSPKDMFDLEKTISCMKRKGITVLGYDSERCDGYLFQGAAAGVSGVWSGEKPAPGLLFLKEVASQSRVKDQALLKQACAYGKEQEGGGGQYHPAVNACLDELTRRESSRIQLQSLAANVKWADYLSASAD